MPAVAITAQQKREAKVTMKKKRCEAYLRGMIRAKDKTNKECAEVIGLTPPGFSLALKNMSFSVSQLLILLDYLGASDADILYIFL